MQNSTNNFNWNLQDIAIKRKLLERPCRKETWNFSKGVPKLEIVGKPGYSWKIIGKLKFHYSKWCKNIWLLKLLESCRKNWKLLNNIWKVVAKNWKLLVKTGNWWKVLLKTGNWWKVPVKPGNSWKVLVKTGNDWKVLVKTVNCRKLLVNLRNCCKNENKNRELLLLHCVAKTYNF